MGFVYVCLHIDIHRHKTLTMFVGVVSLRYHTPHNMLCGVIMEWHNSHKHDQSLLTMILIVRSGENTLSR